MKIMLALLFLTSVSFAQTKQWTVSDITYRGCSGLKSCEDKVKKMKEYLMHCKKVAHSDYACDEKHVALAKESQKYFEQDVKNEQVAAPLSKSDLQKVINHREPVPKTKSRSNQ